MKRRFLHYLLLDKNPKFRVNKHTIPCSHIKDIRPIKKKWHGCPKINCIKLSLLHPQRNKHLEEFELERDKILSEYKEIRTGDLDKALNNLILESKVVPTIDYQNYIIAKLIKVLTKKFRTLIYHKFRYMVGYNRQWPTQDDLVQEFLCNMIENIRWYFPTHTYEHCYNSSYLSTIRRGFTLGIYHTHESRRLLLGDADTGFYHRNIKIEALDEEDLSSDIENEIIYDIRCKSLSEEERLILNELLDYDENDNVEDPNKRDRYVARNLGINTSRVTAFRSRLYKEYEGK